MKKSGLSLDDIQAQDLISLMEVYLAEWTHRDDILWAQVFRFFYATMLVLFLPYVSDFLGITLPKDVPYLAFPIAGLVLSVLFLYVSLGYAKRLEAIAETYNDLINYLPNNKLRRCSLNDPRIKLGKYFSPHMSIIISVIMFLCSSVLSVVMMFIE